MDFGGGKEREIISVSINWFQVKTNYDYKA